MPDSTSTELRKTALEEAAGTDPSIIPTGGSDDAVAQAEAYMLKNKGTIVDFLNNLPAPLLAILKSLAHIALIPLHVIESLPLGSIYTNLNNFANSNSCQPPLPTSASDCVPPQGM